ncbi:MAG: hypothetical protein ACKVTZ_04955 [Bacteroidia bacterium]
MKMIHFYFIAVALFCFSCKTGAFVSSTKTPVHAVPPLVSSSETKLPPQNLPQVSPIDSFFSWQYYDMMKEDSAAFPVNDLKKPTFASVTLRHFKVVLTENNYTRYYLDSVVLQASQIETTSVFLRQLQPSDAIARCYDPHHEFIYRNEKNEVVGILEICFLCSQMKYLSEHRKSRFPLEAKATEDLKRLVLSFGVLVGEGE